MAGASGVQSRFFLEMLLLQCWSCCWRVGSVVGMLELLLEG